MMNDVPARVSVNHNYPEFTSIPKQIDDKGARNWHSYAQPSPVCHNLGCVLCRDDYGDRLGLVDIQRSLSTVSSACDTVSAYSSDADDEDESLGFPPYSCPKPKPKLLSIRMDPNHLSPDTNPQGRGRRRRSAASLTERVHTAMASLRRGSTSTSRTRGSVAGSDSNPSNSTQSTTSIIHTPHTANSRDQSAYTTEDDRDSSEEVHSIDDSFDSGLLEDDPFANLASPPSECHSPLSKLWFGSLSSEVIREEPEEFYEKNAKHLSLKRSSSVDALHILKKCEEEEEDEAILDDDNASINTSNTHEEDEERSRSVDTHERKRTNSFTQRVRNMVHSRPSLPSLSVLATTKIFLPTSRSVLASRFPSEPWDDPKYTTDPTNHIRTTSSQKGSSRSGGYGGGERYGHFDNSNGAGRSYTSPHRVGGGGGGSGAGGHGRDDREPPYRSGGNSRSTSEDNTEETNSTSSSDDVPLGQRPNALSAQKSLRKKIKEERRSRKETIKSSVLRPQAELSVSPKSRVPPTLADDLTARLLRLRANTPSSSLPTSPNGRTAFPTLPTQSASRPVSPTAHTQTSPTRGHFAPSFPSSFRSTAPNDIPFSSDIPVSSLAFPSSSSPAVPLKRHVTDAHAQHNYLPMPRPSMPERSMTSIDQPRSGMVSPSYLDSRRPSMSYEAAKALPTPHQRTRADTLIQKIKSPALPSVGKLRARANSLATARNAPPPLPPLPAPPISNHNASQNAPFFGEETSHTSAAPMMQQRIFINDLQRYSVIEIGGRTNAREVLTMIEDKGDLTAEEMQGGDWMLFEMANDFGMERPIREFELVIEIYNSWNSDTRVNYFMLKKTPWAPLLAASAVPKSSPTHGGYVEWEHKRGKWTKRWLELREHSLWISKRQGAKDATVLCALSSFDGYIVTRLHKSPKPFVFSIKSVQNMRLFERAQDYHHVFCCESEEGREWWKNILLARSYVLHQERMVLFNPFKSTSTSRPATRQGGQRALPPPLLNVPVNTSPISPLIKDAQSPPATVDGFQPMPGSLLAKRA